jgi:hypothetical protein
MIGCVCLIVPPGQWGLKGWQITAVGELKVCFSLLAQADLKLSV